MSDINKYQFLKKRLYLNDLPNDLNKAIRNELEYNPIYNPSLYSTIFDMKIEEESKMNQALIFSKYVKNKKLKKTNFLVKQRRDKFLRLSKRLRFLINAIEDFFKQKGISKYTRMVNDIRNIRKT